MKKITFVLLAASALILSSCGNSNSEDASSSSKAQESSSKSTDSTKKSSKSGSDWKLKTSGDKTTLVFSTGEVKGGFPDEDAVKDDFKQYIHIEVDSSLECEQYGYVGNSHGRVMEWANSPDAKVKDMTIKKDAIPASYSVKDDQDREILYHLYDEAFEKKYIEESEEDDLYTYMQPVPPLNKFDENLTELEEEGATEIDKKTGEAEGFKYTSMSYHYEDDEPADGVFYVIYELSDSVRFSYRVRPVGADFDPQAEVDKMAKNITLDK